ncbi:Laminin N-terminal domain-containing protein [Caenorhabditis elegans]|uniref:Laminin N-terminal domain-containing protein n=1 Tax=Caenorhabditis elegans TaxID=6239 RepID=Q565C5_CAEEL|nr:Laminin N-terminal domain-containing protein [Caenorhabditis elegans]CAI79121.1 Laminin N-terminal domain-containing protein [Caenorhabditis elegans]|eukprot:NP_001024539.1 Uncharacterized protein CELE_F08G12.11 [Caenorhabditis elegans]
MNKNKCFFLFLVLGASQAENRCVQEENCTLTVDNPGINTKSCEGYLMEECACVQRRSVNFEYDCHCCKNQTRPKRTVPLEAMFGLKTYVAPDDTPMLMVEPPANTHAPVIVTTTMEPAIQFQTLRKPNGLCGKLEFG